MAEILNDIKNAAKLLALFEDMTKTPANRKMTSLNYAAIIVSSFSSDYDRLKRRIEFILVSVSRLAANPTSVIEDLKFKDEFIEDLLSCAQEKNAKSETPLPTEVFEQQFDVVMFKEREKFGLVNDTKYLECANCLQCTQRTKKCSGCRIFSYCDKNCQTAHWGEHRSLCKAVRCL
jgi:hypothetical protein